MRFALLACLAMAIGCSQEIVDRAPVTGSELALPAANDTPIANDTLAADDASETPPATSDTPPADVTSSANDTPPAAKDAPAADESNDAKVTNEQPAPVASAPELPSYTEALDIADHEARLVQVAKFDLDGHERRQARLKKQLEDEPRSNASDSSAKPAANNAARLDADLERVSKEIEASKDSLRRAQARLDYATDIVNQIIKRDGREKSAE